METPVTHVKCDLFIKLDRDKIARYMKLPRHAPTAMVSKPSAESGLVSQNFFINYTFTIHCLHV